MFHGSTALVDLALLILDLSVSYTDTTFGANPLEEWSALRRNRYQTSIQHSQETHIFTADGIWN